MSEAVRMLGPESPFSNGAKPGEGEEFARDAFDHEKDGRFEIDPFRFARYIVLGWIRESERFPYYELTVAGETIYSRERQRMTRAWWDDDDD